MSWKSCLDAWRHLSQSGKSACCSSRGPKFDSQNSPEVSSNSSWGDLIPFHGLQKHPHDCDIYTQHSRIHIRKNKSKSLKINLFIRFGICNTIPHKALQDQVHGDAVISDSRCLGWDPVCTLKMYFLALHYDLNLNFIHGTLWALDLCNVYW